MRWCQGLEIAKQNQCEGFLACSSLLGVGVHDTLARMAVDSYILKNKAQFPEIVLKKQKSKCNVQ